MDMGSNAHEALRRLAEPAQAPAADVRLSFEAVAENVALARSGIGAFAAAAGLAQGVADDMRIALTEAVSNVVRHAYAADRPGGVEIVVRLERERVRLVVSDEGRGIGPASADRDGPGLGLPLIAVLAETVDLHAAACGGACLEMTFNRRAAA
jgi:serine/threonine-protein kinase RsbW